MTFSKKPLRPVPFKRKEVSFQFASADEPLAQTNIVSATKNATLPGVTLKMKAALETRNLQAVLDALSPLQKRFVEEFIIDLNATQAYVRSGYAYKDHKEAGDKAHILKKNPGIKFAIDGLLLQRNKSSDVTSDWVLKKIVDTIQRCETAEDYNPNAILRGAELIAKHLGMFIERTEISGKDGEAIKYEKVKQDAADFTSAIASLANRARAAGVAGVSDTGTEG